MRDVKDILYDFNIALEDNDYIEMIDLIKEMKSTDPSFVDLMLNSIEEDE
jgi:hypothetical protein